MNIESKILRAIGIAAERHKIRPEIIADKANGTADVIDARRTAFAEAVDMGVTRKAIGRFFNLDWSTVNYHVRTLRDGLPLPRTGFGATPAPEPPKPPVLPEYRGDWTEIEWMRAMAHEENMAMRGQRA